MLSVMTVCRVSIQRMRKEVADGFVCAIMLFQRIFVRNSFCSMSH